MGKVFITDEVNDMYTADVTNAGAIKVECGAGTSVFLSSAHTTVSAATAYNGACYLRSVIIGQVPATAATLMIYDTYSSAGGVSAFGTSGDNIKARIAFAYGAATAGISASSQNPVVLPLNIYMTSGISVGIGGHSANDSGGYVGCLKGVTLSYQ